MAAQVEEQVLNLRAQADHNPSFVLKKPLELGFEERPVPVITDPRDVKIQVKKTGICGSDVHFWQHGRIGDYVVEKPMVLGHESSGVVVEVGSEVTSLKVGDRVAMEPGVPDRRSKEYKMGRYHLCPHVRFAACPPTDGTLCKYYTLPEDFCVKLPENVDFEEGALVEPLSVAVHTARLLGIYPGSKVVVFGAGPIGQLCIGVCKAFGASIIGAVDLFEQKLETAKEFGASHTYVPQKGDSHDETAHKILELLPNKQAPDVVIDASGAEQSINAGIELLERGGTFGQVAMGRTDYIQFAVSRMAMKEIRFQGVFRYTYGDYELATQLIGDGKIPVKKLVTHRRPFEKAEEAYELVKSGVAVKCIIDGPE
uniref:ARAD1D37840p n=1 Tax=Blastobotrys adeninivorans TaxID=409370 RepID=Q6KAV2_BLAAD|nr:xylitol dehydrogenase [Blastobotrys adeninivorans]